MSAVHNGEARVAVMVDCENAEPDILEHALKMVAQFGRVVLRRAYGNPASLSGRWQEALIQLAFTPCVQLRYVAGKNTADIALALDALEALFDRRAETFCIVASDSDYTYLCRKLRERGATVCIVGEPKTPAALRNASDQFFEWTRRDGTNPAAPAPASVSKADEDKPVPAKPEPPAPAAKRRPRFVVDAVTVLAADTSDGQVSVSALGQYLKRTDPAFSPKTYGHSGLLNMLKTYDLLQTQQHNGGHSTVSLRSFAET